MGRVEVPAESGFPKAHPWCQQFTRGIFMNIGDSLVKVRGSGLKSGF